MRDGGGEPVVAHVVGTWLRSTENWIYDQVRFTRGWRPVVVAKHLENAELFPWPSVHALRSLSTARMLANRLVKWRTGVYPGFRRAATQERASLLHAHFGHLGGVARALAADLGIPFVVSFYGVDMWRHRAGVEGLRATYARDFEAGAGFIAEGPAAAARLVEIGCPPGKVIVHRLGIDPTAFELHERRVGPGEPLRVLMAARFVEKKGLEYGVEAFCRAARREPRLVMTLVGAPRERVPEDRQVAARVHEIIRGYAMQERIHLAGFVPLAALTELTRTHHLLMHPSVHAASGDAEGGHPVVLTQAAATGMPMLATTHCDIPEIVVPGRTGWLAPERDVDALVEALLDFAARPEVLPEYGRNARALVEARYDARRETLDRAYAAALGRTSPQTAGA
jgi:colanic acid/amylovoran biosynthesis glycosyltransferase